MGIKNSRRNRAKKKKDMYIDEYLKVQKIIEEKNNNADEILKDIMEERRIFRETIKKIEEKQSEIFLKKTDSHYQIKEAKENDLKRRDKYLELVFTNLIEQKAGEER